MVGLIGGEPLLVPWFDDMAKYARSKFPREQLGLWSVFPEDPPNAPGRFSRHREVICECFGNVFLNDHTRGDIMHAPILVASQDVIKDKRELFMMADRCWVQNSWSPAVTNRGAFFCEVAGELDQLYGGPGGWDITEPGWWKRVPKDYTEQIERSCINCGACLPLERRSSMDVRCDMSAGAAERLKGRSRKVDKGQVVIQKEGEWHFDQKLVEAARLAAEKGEPSSGYPVQTYKDMDYRQRIANRYGIFLTVDNPRHCWEPHLMSSIPPPVPSVFEIYRERFHPETKTT
jgi:hypothetical protein